jgi:ribosomal protein S18 acetylase RimI-like enzyme
MTTSDVARSPAATTASPTPATAADELVVMSALWTALRSFGRIPGASIIDEDGLTMVRSGTPYGAFNNVLATRLPAAGDAHTRIAHVLAAFAPESLPVTWWVTTTTRPADLAVRLADLGFVKQAPEFAMVIDLDPDRPAAAPPAGATIESVERPGQLDEWIGIMDAAYGWREPPKAAAIRSMYASELLRPEAQRDVHHFLLRAGGVAVACSSLFIGDGQAFVTNIGTRPEAQGRGFGTAATEATLDLARSLGRTLATLTASVDGRWVYRRLGFRDAGVVDRFVADARLATRLARKAR